jgi:hypothetical protein
LERAASGDLSAGWRDLDAARQLMGESADWQRLQQAVSEVAVGDIINHLHAGDFLGASARIGALERRDIPGAPIKTLSEVARKLESARKLAQRGRFAEAEEQLAAAAALQPDLALIEDQRKLCRERAERSRDLQQQLHAALAASDWNTVLSRANELIEIAPENRVARDARKRAWAEVGEQIGDSRRLGDTQHWHASGERDASASRSLGAAGGLAGSPRAARFMLWIDGVGGYLVCLGDEVVVGQAHPGTTVDVPIQADISRRHVKIARQGEGYVLEPLGGRVVLDGKPLSEATLLSDGDEIVLGEGVKFRFRKPHVLSASARLELISAHRTQPYADAIILMAESCVLGPKWQNHVVCRDWGGDAVAAWSRLKLTAACSRAAAPCGPARTSLEMTFR